VATTFFTGAVSIDEMSFPIDTIFRMSLRVFDPISHQWSIYGVGSLDRKVVRSSDRVPSQRSQHPLRLC